MAYVLVSDLKEYLGISDDSDDALLKAFIVRAQSIIDAYTGRTFEASADATRYHTEDMVDGSALWFDGDVSAITSIVNGDGTTVPTADYVTMPRNRTPYYGVAIKSTATTVTSWDYTTGDIAVTGRWAYSTTPPADIAQATIRLAAYLYRQKDNANDLDRALVVGNSTILPAKLPADLAQILSAYRRLS